MLSLSLSPLVLFDSFLFLDRRRICTRWKKLESDENERTELILGAREKQKAASRVFHGALAITLRWRGARKGTFASDCQISGARVTGRRTAVVLRDRSRSFVSARPDRNFCYEYSR